MPGKAPRPTILQAILFSDMKTDSNQKSAIFDGEGGGGGNSLGCCQLCARERFGEYDSCCDMAQNQDQLAQKMTFRRRCVLFGVVMLLMLMD